MCANCLCCEGNKQTIIAKKCGCWVFHFKKRPWEEQQPPKLREALEESQ